MNENTNINYQVIESIEVGGPLDAYVDYFWELANRDRYYGSDPDETPCHSIERAVDIGNIARRLIDRENNETETEFFVTIFRDSDNDPYWVITDSFEKISETSELLPNLGDIDIIYRISGDIYEPDLDIVKDANRVEYATHYSEESDITFITKTTYKNGIKVTEEVTGFYYGMPDECQTTFFKNKNVITITYQF